MSDCYFVWLGPKGEPWATVEPALMAQARNNWCAYAPHDDVYDIRCAVIAGSVDEAIQTALARRQECIDKGLLPDREARR